MSMTMVEFEALRDARNREAKRLFMKALKDVVPKGYLLSDDQRKMYANAYLCLRPEMSDAGMYSISFFHGIDYRSINNGGEILINPVAECVWMLADTYAGPGVRTGLPETRDEPVRYYVAGNDLAASVRQAASELMAMPPFVRFDWRRSPHDKDTLEVFNGDARLGKIWKSGKRWGTLTGNSFATRRGAMADAESCEASIIRTWHQERLAGLGDSI